MCGIAGFAGAGDRADLQSMTDALRHRGPDGEGSFIDGPTGVHLGHRRLAILDVTHGAQPMWDGEATVCVTYNGEIYNHAELRSELTAKGHRFHTSHSDTEVLIHGYKEWGAALAERLNGMFAFAIYDRPRQRLFLARDRFGEKPLYYAHRPGLFAFASELTALVAHRQLPRNLCLASLQKYIAQGYLPAPNAIFEGCRKLPAGHRMTYQIDSGELTLDRYWRFKLQPDERLETAKEGELAEQLRELVSQSVQRRLISDVPLGVFLSGGIDSSAVVASCSRHLPADRIRSFCIGFTESSFDESAYARRVSELFGTTHHEETLDLDTARSLIPEVLSRLDEPLGDPSLLPTFLLSRYTRQHVTVALSGDGGDELFAGYDTFKALKLARYYDRVVPGWVHRKVRRLADLLPISGKNMSFDFKLRRALTGLSYPQPFWNPVWLGPVEPDQLRDLFEAPLHTEEVFAEALAAWSETESTNLLDRTLEFYTRVYLQDDILTKVDRAAMMVSLESRAVFLDNDLVDFCQRLPNSLKYRRGQRKYLLKKAFEGVLPADLLNRPKKGFGIPTARWLQQLPEPCDQPLSPAVRQNWIERRRSEHRNGKADHRLLLWSWMSAQEALSPRVKESDAMKKAV